MKTCIIVNPNAGSAGDLKVLREKLARLQPNEIKVTTDAGDAMHFASEAVSSHYDLIISAGGDGTLNEVVNGLAEKSRTTRLAILPLGTGNDFARSIGLSKDLDECLDIIIRGKTKQIDLVRVTSDQVRYFVNVSTGGFSGVVDEKLTAEIKKTWGPLAYLRSAAAALAELRAYKTKITFDDIDTLDVALHNVVIGNGRYVAGGIPVTPEAVLDDGLVDIVLIPERTKTELAFAVAEVLLGKHLNNENIVYRRAKKVSVSSKPGMWFNVDGELVGNEPALFEVLPGALPFIVGEI